MKKYWSGQIEDKIGATCRVNQLLREVYKSESYNLKTREQLEDLRIDGIIILKLMRI